MRILGIYVRELAAAISAARIGGGILRADLFRAGGPRGSGSKADADAEAEALIRRALLEEFPTYGVHGEELPAEDRPAADGAHVWVIDPNDGTSDYLRGCRGSAVSIALVREGVPVLGVVYAFAPPMGEEDLITWCEGEAVRRNGIAVQTARAGAIAASHTVLVSARGDSAVAYNATAAAPARFRSMPSIAYRLALVAVGDAEAAVSLNSPSSLDYAAGHALLRGAGLELVNEAGDIVSYDRRARGGVTRCFGGALDTCRALAARPVWRRSPAMDTIPKEPYAQVLPLRDRHISDSGRLSRAQGCLLGQLSGDALGSLVEFQGPREIAERYPAGPRILEDGGTWSTLAGQPTDDSELALLLARALVKQGKLDEEEVAGAYAYWIRSGPFDVGNTTNAALRSAAAAVQAGTSAASAARAAANVDSQANGGLMRISPLGVFGWAAAPAEVASWARLDARLTHPHLMCQEASALFAATIAFAIREGASPKAVHEFAIGLTKELELSLFAPLILAAATAPPADYVTHMGHVVIALQNAFYQLLHAPSLEEGVVQTVMQGGDTDTNAAIAGALLGAVHGAEAVPEQWRDRVLTCRPLAGLPQVRRPRPPCLWPVDALILAERLLLSGERHLDG